MKELTTIWDALHGYREDCTPPDDEWWNEICGAMAIVTEKLGLDPADPDTTD